MDVEKELSQSLEEMTQELKEYKIALTDLQFMLCERPATDGEREFRVAIEEAGSRAYELESTQQANEARVKEIMEKTLRPVELNGVPCFEPFLPPKTPLLTSLISFFGSPAA